MSFDYDLVVIGGTRAGISAAIAAANLNARVAFVYPADEALPGDLPPSSLLPPAFDAQPISANPPSLAAALTWANGVRDTLAATHSPAVLASLGIDAIAGMGQFTPLPQLTFNVNTRRLIARRYLLAVGSRSAIPDIPGLHRTGYLTWETLPQLTDNALPQTAIAIGSDPSAIELTQILLRLGIRVTLIVPTSSILPEEDPEVAQLIQAQLETQGVRVITNSPVTQVKPLEGQKWVQAGDKAIAGDKLFIACGFHSQIDSLNLETLGVKFRPTSLGKRVQVNPKLQTTNRNIYACGNLAGGYPLLNIAEYEAQIAVKNALFWPTRTVDYRGIPWSFNTLPPLARVGFTEAQAKRRYPDVIILRQYPKNTLSAQLHGEIIGLCKLVVRRNGELLGAHLVGSHARELIHPFALAIQTKTKIQAIASLSPICPSRSEIIAQTAQLWQQQRFQRNSLWQTLLEAFFNGRRF
ncbi:dihydrolipoyl dehydrogenase family protein [Phormidium sp. CCY1219]|uniref:dihydrolipoyl dehydrogenase family protein n=1 Tax=Phormidium sp. CCY1219 TaxID=2886104 RepID=UPI002D1E5EA2|nr:NAD(P)/FAD-dependent oxidoreductase [Phormidium sp. CCY1219]MEB3827310.1 NAD(P)/FAD-dependent oxidoreductase [Phormidium sp. CCY1219]